MRLIFQDQVRIKFTKIHKSCDWCYGFGIFNERGELDVCPECGSVHPEYFQKTKEAGRPVYLYLE